MSKSISELNHYEKLTGLDEKLKKKLWRIEGEMRKILVVIDMQNDFIDGALGTPEAAGIVT